MRRWGGRWDSNPRQPGSQPGALPTELRPPWSPRRRRHGRKPLKVKELRRPDRDGSGPIPSRRGANYIRSFCRRTSSDRRPRPPASPAPQPETSSARNGAPGGTRTPDPRLRRPMLYPPELRAQRRGTDGLYATPGGPISGAHFPAGHSRQRAGSRHSPGLSSSPGRPWGSSRRQAHRMRTSFASRRTVPKMYGRCEDEVARVKGKWLIQSRNVFP
jgi:hypothetical protein